MRNKFDIQKRKMLGAKLKQARLEIELSQSQVAKLLNKSQDYISRSETGFRRVDIFELNEFAKLYKKDITIFLDYSKLDLWGDD